MQGRKVYSCIFLGGFFLVGKLKSFVITACFNLVSLSMYFYFFFLLKEVNSAKHVLGVKKLTFME